MGKENGAARKPPASRHSKSMRMERGHIADTTPARSQSFGAAAASRIRPLAPHPSPAELERKHSQIIRKPSRIFAGRPVLRTPRLDHASSIFSKLQSALSDYGRYLEEALESVEPKRKRIVEQRIKLIDSRLQQIDEIFQLYLYEQKMREGSRNLLNALTLQGSKGGQDKCRSSFNNCTEKMCAIEEELESKLGVFRFRLNALLAFGRLCSGDVYDVHIKHGTTFKWKSRCKVESREGQKWIDDEFTFRPSITDALSIRVIEMRKIQANVQIGNVLLHTRNYIKARPQIVSVPLNSTGSMKLKVTIEWRPFSGKEENTLRSKRQSLLSEVIFIPATPSSSEVSGSSGEENRPDVVERETAESLLSDENPLQLLQLAEEDVTLSSEVVDAGLPLEVDGMIAEEPQDFRHATSLDGALQHLIPTLQTYKDQFPELQNLIALLERLEEIVKKCTLSRSSMSLSVESALESFDFLEQDTVDEANTTPRSTASGGSGCHDTGYNSTDDYAKDLAGEGTGESHDYIVDFMTTEKAVENHVGDSDENDAQRKIEEDVVDQSKSQGEENQSSSQGSRGLKEKALGTSLEELGSEAPRDAETTNHNSAHGEDDSPSCLTDIFPSASSPSPAHKSQSLDETGSQAGSKEGASSVPSAVNSPGKKLEAGSTELSEHSSSKARSSRATSPNLSSAFSQEATVGHKVLDKVLLSHLQFCEEVSGHLGSFGPMKSKEMSALSNLRRQSEVLERLVNFIVSTDPVDSLTLQQINPRLVSSAALCSLWERSFQGSPLFTTAGALVSGFEDNYKKQIIQSYNRVSDVVFPVIVARVIHQDPDLTDVHAEEEDVVSVFQFEYYFMDYCRRNLSKYIDEVAYELVISKRLLSPEKDAVTAQLKQYTEIPLSKTCFNTVLCLLLDGDIVAQAAEAYLVNLHKNADLRKKAISLSIEALEESEERLREGACVAITVLQARDSVPQLLYLSRCDVQSVKFAARKALSALGEEGEDALRMSTMSSSEIAGLMF